MIYKNEKEITGIYVADKVITAVYAGARIVWEAIRSCYGKGYWADERPWIDEDGWKD